MGKYAALQHQRIQLQEEVAQRKSRSRRMLHRGGHAAGHRRTIYKSAPHEGAMFVAQIWKEREHSFTPVSLLWPADFMVWIIDSFLSQRAARSAVVAGTLWFWWPRWHRHDCISRWFEASHLSCHALPLICISSTPANSHPPSFLRGN